jgi:hypothetical protein
MNKADRCIGQRILGNLTVKYRAERSFFEYNPHVLKSGIQKYARRNEVKKGLWCLIEMDLFSLLEGEGSALDAYLQRFPKVAREKVKTRAKTIRTNMINRLVVMMSEEVNISAWWMPIKMLELYNRWVENRGNASSRKVLMDIYRYLLSQRMIRLISDLKSVYVLPPYYVKPKQMNDFSKIHRNIQASYPAVYSDQAKVGNVDWDLTDYPANVRPCIKGIVYNLGKGSDHAFYWISKLCDLEKEDGTSKYRYLQLVWSVLYHFIDRHRENEVVRDTISALEFFFKKMGHQEKPIYLYHAMLLLIRRFEIDWSYSPPLIDTPIVDVDKLYRRHLVGGKMPMDSYILDLHTHGGKRSVGCLQNFAIEGAYIKNENVNFLRQDYRDIYIKLKQELDLYRSRGARLQ